MKRTIHFFFGLILSVMLAACGGGGTAAQVTDLTLLSASIPVDAVNVPVNSKISFTFNMPMAECSNDCVTLEGNGTISPGRITASGAVIEFSPASGLRPNTSYFVEISAVGSLSNDFFFSDHSRHSPSSFYFTTGNSLDTAPPYVSSNSQTLLSNGKTAVNSSFAVTFSEAMDAASINTNTFTISSNMQAPVSGTVSYSGNTAAFRPDIDLDYSKSYIALITTGVKDLAGNQMSAAYSWQFTTGVAPDTVPPTVISTDPFNNSTGVVHSSAISILFSENVKTSNLAFTVNDGNQNVAGSILFSGSTVTFKPSVALVANTTYTATVSGATDLSGNTNAAPYSWIFTAAPPVPPTVLTVSPANNNLGSSINAVFVANFSQDMDGGSITPTTFTISPNIAGTLSYANRQAKFSPSAPLMSNTAYTVTISNSVTNTVGVPLAANYSWMFTTVPPVQLAVLSTSPASNISLSTISAPIVARFNKNLDATSCNQSSFTVSGGTIGSVTCSTNTLTFSPSVPLSLATSYTATITTGIKDYEGLTLASNYSWNFNTRTEYVAPTVMGASHNATGVNVEFSEVMNPSSINSTTFNLSPAAAGTVTSSGAGATFTPSSPLAKDTAYTVTISGAKDSAGNTQAANYIWTFLTDPGSVVPFEAYGGNCFGTTPFGVYAQNQTAYNQDITICVHNAATGNPSCQAFPNIAPNQYTFHSYVTTANAYIGSVSVCYSSGQYTVSWVKTGGPTTSARTDTFTSTTYAPTSPTVDPCLYGAIACVPKITVAPVVSDTTSTTSTTYPPASLTPSTSPDADGCYVPQHNPECLEVEKSTLSTSNYQIIRLRNNCTQRVYAEICNQHINGTWDCGADGASPGGATSYWTYDANGKYKYQYTGSTQWMSDWVCAGRDPNWSMNFGK